MDYILIDYFILVMLTNTKKIDNVLLVECEETGIYVEMLTKIKRVSVPS
jgi:hypothetical protein